MMHIEHTYSPSSKDIEFLTKNINEESKQHGVKEDAHSFAFFIRDDNDAIIAGCNGFVVFGAIYTDQLWVHRDYRQQGLGRKLMQQVHEYGRASSCNMATVATMSFQGALSFYERLGYSCDFERKGYAATSSCLFLQMKL